MAEMRVLIEGGVNPSTGATVNPLPVSGTVTTTPSGTQTVAGTVTANQGTAGTASASWFTKHVDAGGVNVQTVDASGRALVLSAQGTAAATAGAWPIIVSDGTTTASVTGLNALRVATGNTTAMTTLNAVTANTTGTTVALGSAYSNWSAVAVATGSPTAGTLTLELSHDGTNWVSSSATASITAAGNYLIASTGRAARYGRVSLTGLTGTISLTVTMMAAG